MSVKTQETEEGADLEPLSEQRQGHPFVRRRDTTCSETVLRFAGTLITSILHFLLSTLFPCLQERLSTGQPSLPRHPTGSGNFLFLSLSLDGEELSDPACSVTRLRTVTEQPGTDSCTPS